MRETKFKHSAIGDFPIDWKELSIKDLGPISKGRGISRAECGTGAIPCVRYGEIYTDHDNYIKSFKSFVSSNVAEASRKLQHGELLFTGSGETKEEIGKCVAFIGYEEAYAGGDIVIVSPNLDKNDPLFLGYLMNSRYVVNQKALRGQGDAVVHITGKTLATVKLVVPPLAEQRKIAKALSDMDALIDSMNKLIEKKRNIKTGAMQELLTGKKRLDGFTDLWQTKAFKDIYSFASEGGTPSTSNPSYYNGDISFAKIEDTESKYLSNTRTHITDLGLNNSSAWMIPINNILFTNGATIGNVCINKIPVCTKQGILGLIVREAYDVEFLYYLLSSSDFQREVHSREAKGTFATIILKNLNEITVVVPSKPEQTAIATILSDMDKEIAALEQKRNKYEAMKKGMMQDLLTGKIRLV